MSESLETNSKKVDYNNLTLEQKAAYAYVLNTIFKNAIPFAYDRDITPELARNADIIINEISTCSKTMAGINIVFDIFYPVTGTLTAADILLNLTITLFRDSFSSWVAVLEGNKVYSSCVNSTILKWRTCIGLMPYGLVSDC